MGNLDGDEKEGHQEVAAKRSQKVLNFVLSRRFRDGVAIAAITSLPRWHMARALFKDNVNADGPRTTASPGTGIGHALRLCLTDTEYILSGKCDLVDYVLRDYADFERGVFQLDVLRALLRTVVYLLSAIVNFPSAVRIAKHEF